jgi:hypothetical protein
MVPERNLKATGGSPHARGRSSNLKRPVAAFHGSWKEVGGHRRTSRCPEGVTASPRGQLWSQRGILLPQLDVRVLQMRFYALKRLVAAPRGPKEPYYAFDGFFWCLRCLEVCT